MHDEGTVSSLSVVVPVFNSEGTIADLCTQLEATLPTLADDYEVILVNDGSRDDSWRVTPQAAAISARST